VTALAVRSPIDQAARGPLGRVAEALTARLEAAADAPLGDRRRTCAAIRTYQTLVRPLPAILLASTEKAELLADVVRISAVVGC
jgi:hypothetical protein